MTDLNEEYLEKLEKGETVIIPLHEERILIKKEKRVVEEIVIRREKYIEMVKIQVPIKKEVLTIDEKNLDQ